MKKQNFLYSQMRQCFFLLIVSIAVLAGCQSGKKAEQTASSEEEQKRPTVLALNYPLASIANQLAGDLIELRCPVPESKDPALWSPNDSEIQELQQADLVLLNEAGHEPWREQVTLSPLNLAFTSRGFRDQWIKEKQTEMHRHGPDDDWHAHSEIAYTTWLDPLLFQEQIHVVGKAIANILPDQRKVIDAKVIMMKSELDLLNKQWQTITLKLKGGAMLASHPVYQYPAKKYQWNLSSLHWEPEQKLTEEDWKAFDKLHQETKAKWMLWEDAPLEETKQELAKRNIKIIVFKPLGNGPISTNVLDQMKENALRFENAIKEE